MGGGENNEGSPPPPHLFANLVFVLHIEVLYWFVFAICTYSVQASTCGHLMLRPIQLDAVMTHANCSEAALSLYRPAQTSEHSDTREQTCAKLHTEDSHDNFGHLLA